GYADGREARAGIDAWIAFYNTRRPHQALGGQAPMAVWRAGTSGLLDARAVDMTLRLDNAAALPTVATAAGLRGLILGEVGDGSASNYKDARRGPTHGVHFNDVGRWWAKAREIAAYQKHRVKRIRRSGPTPPSGPSH